MGRTVQLRGNHVLTFLFRYKTYKHSSKPKKKRLDFTNVQTEQGHPLPDFPTMDEEENEEVNEDAALPVDKVSQDLSDIVSGEFEAGTCGATQGTCDIVSQAVSTVDPPKEDDEGLYDM